jgi:hypothetical protein
LDGIKPYFRFGRAVTADDVLAPSIRAGGSLNEKGQGRNAEAETPRM